MNTNKLIIHYFTMISKNLSNHIKQEDNFGQTQIE